MQKNEGGEKKTNGSYERKILNCIIVNFPMHLPPPAYHCTFKSSAISVI